MMQDVVTALGLVLVIEGLLYALLAAPMRQAMRMALDQLSDSQLRAGGVAALALGVLIVWLARGGG